MTAYLQAKNRAKSKLASDVNAGATTWTVITGEGAKFPSAYPFHITCEDEIVRCTLRVGDVLTVTRAQEGTGASPHLADEDVELRITALIIKQLQDHEALDTGVHGVGASTVCSEATADSKIATHGVSGKHRWTLNKIRVGAGAGSDPTEADLPTGLVFTELAGGENKYGALASWLDWDISAIIPSGSLYALIGIGSLNVVINKAGARQNGTALARYLAVPINSSQHPSVCVLTKVDENRIIEIYGHGSNALRFHVLGYWK